MSIFNVITLFGGLALFLYGMRLMSSGLKESSTGTLKRVMEKVTNNLFKAFLLGMVITAIIQSSTATIVITSGLVAAGILTLRQSVGIIVGANVGTTVTGQIIRLMDLNSSGTAWLQFFKPATLAPIALIIGIILIMFINFNKSDVIGQILMGFGILFTGLMNMTSAVNQLSETGAFDSLFSLLGNSPLIGYLVGVLVSFILQSSSATIGILQAFSVSGQLYFKSIYSVLVGIYLGDCLTTAIVCSIGAKAEAKRVGVVNVLFNLSETVLVFIGINLAHNLGLLDNIWNSVVNSGVIANTNTIFNLSCSIVLFPIVRQYEKLSKVIIKDDKSPLHEYSSLVDGMSEKFYDTPALAFNACYKVLALMFDLAKENIDKAFSLFENYDEKIFKDINDKEEIIDTLTDKTENYLVGLNAYIKLKEQSLILNEYHNLTIEFERLGDHAKNIAEEANTIYSHNIKFSDVAIKELDVIKDLLGNVLEYSRIAFYKRNLDAANNIEPLEEVVDDMVDALKEHHLKRLENGECNIEGGTVFLNMLQDVERISDVCSNIGEATVIRILPEYQGKMHMYMQRLHDGHNETYNVAYEQAHKKYFAAIIKIHEGD